MTCFWLPLLAGIFIGCFLGLLAAGLCIMAHDSDSDSDNWLE